MRKAAFIFAVVSVCLCAVLLYRFEKKKITVHRLMMIAVMTGAAVAGRFVFAAVPGFKPVTAVVVLCGMYFGADAGFMCGALTALVSNIYFGQGPWTPLQMLVWGLLGALAALLSPILKKNRFFLALYGVVAGVLFSLLMDVYTVIWTLDGWSFYVYLAAIASALPYTVIYAVSNVIFLIGLSVPFAKKLERTERRCYNLYS